MDRTQAPEVPTSVVPVPPPRRGRAVRPLGLHALQVLSLVGLPPLAAAAVIWATRSQRRLAAGPGRPRTYTDASILVIALVARLWHLSSREVCQWLVRWPALASACGLPAGQVIHPAHFSRRLRQLGAYPLWLLYLALVWRALQVGLVSGRDVVLDATFLRAWTKHDPDATLSYKTPKGRIFGYKLHLLLDRAGRLPLLFVLSLAHCHDAPFAYPLLGLARGLLGLPIRVVRADAAYWGLTLVRFIVTVLGARPVIPFNKKRQHLDRVRLLAWRAVNWTARAVIERFFAAAKRYYQLDTRYACGWEAVLQCVSLTCCAILIVALAAHAAGRPDLRLSPTRVLAHYLPVDDQP